MLTEYLDHDWPVFLCPTMVQEILQGIVDDRHFDEIKEYLLAFNILKDDPLEMAIAAARLYRNARKKGLTLRRAMIG